MIICCGWADWGYPTGYDVEGVIGMGTGETRDCDKERPRGA
jgi:hypothetical protein